MEDSNFFNLFSEKKLNDADLSDNKNVSKPIPEEIGKEEPLADEKSDREQNVINDPDPNNISRPPVDINNSESDSQTAANENNRSSQNDDPPSKGDDPLIENITVLSDQLKTRSANVDEALIKLSDKLDKIESSVTRLASYDTAVEALKRSVNANQNNEKKLYEEVEAYKRGVYLTNIKPFLLYIIEMLCEMKSSKRQYQEEREEFIAENNEKVYDEICSMLDFYIDSFESQLRVQGVSIITFEAGTRYEAIQQSVAKTIPTEDANMVGMVANVLSDCYTYDNKVLRPAKVYVYKQAKQ